MAGPGPDRWREIAPHLDRALELEGEERAAWLEGLRAQDPALAAEIEGMLAEHRALSHEGFLDTSPALAGKLRAMVAAVLSTGAVVGGRYRVVRFIAGGGMGEVYEVEDLTLGSRVALKTIRTDRAHDSTTRERFRREIQLARTITHRNVCRIFDVGYHDGGGGDRSTMFLTMELLAGETLAEHLARAGAMPLAEAAPVALQLLEALGAAHAVGIVHRDFKTGNVMLVPGSDGVRAVVTDFGLAKPAAAERLQAARLSATQQVVGTPGYMAPEQRQGGPVSPATDLYAFGVVLCEMLTGQRPLAASTTGAAEDGPPPSPPALPPGLPARARRVIRRCLQPAPADRYQSVKEVVRALAVRPGRRAALAAGAAAAVVGAAVAAGGTAVWRARRGRAPAGARRRRPALALIGLANLPGRSEDEWLALALAELLRAGLARDGVLRVIPDDEVAGLRRDLRLPGGQPVERAALPRLRGRTGADFVLSGSCLVVAGAGRREVALLLRMQDAATGEVTEVASERGSDGDLARPAARAAAAIRQRLGAAAPADEKALVAGALPGDAAAARVYVEGLERWRALDLTGATARMERVLALEAGFPPANDALARIWDGRGHAANARDHARLAFGGVAGVDRDPRLLLEAHMLETSGEPARAAAIYADLRRRYPDEPTHGLALGRAQLRAGRPSQALATASALRRELGSPRADDARIDLLEAEAHGQAGDDKAREAAAARAAAVARAAGARELTAAALIARAWAQRRLGRPAEALAGFSEARGLAEAAGDGARAGAALHGTAAARLDRGELPAALEGADAAITRLIAAGAEGELARAMALRARTLMELGRLGEAVDGFQESERRHHHLDARDEAIAVAALGRAEALIELGRLDDADAAIVVATSLFTTTGSAPGMRRCDLLSAIIARHRGELARARQLLAGAPVAVEPLLEEQLGETLFAEEQQSEARAAHRRALATRQRAGIARLVARSELALARLALHDGDLAEAARLSRAARTVFETASQRDHAAEAGLVLAAALAGQEARDTLAIALQAAEHTERFALRLGAQAAAHPGRRASLAAQAERAGFVTLARALREASARR